MGAVAVVLLAAGSGRRLGGTIPKQYREVAGVPMVLHALRSLQAEPRIRWVQPVIAAGEERRFASAIGEASFAFTLLSPVAGGRERALSMVAGLRALPKQATMVAVHDAARPLPSPRLLQALLDGAERHGAAVPGMAVVDTIKEVDAAGRVVRTLDRHTLRAVQTPQVARREWLLAAIAQAGEGLATFTDDVSLLEATGFPVYVTPGEERNRKVTTAEDLRWMEELLRRDG